MVVDRLSDVLKYVISLLKVTDYLVAFGLLFSVYGISYWFTQSLVLSVFIVCGMLLLLIMSFLLYSRLRVNRIEYKKDLELMDSVTLSGKDQSLGYEKIKCSLGDVDYDYVVMSDIVNRELRSVELPIEVNIERKRKLGLYIRSRLLHNVSLLSNQVIDSLKNKKMFFNDAKVRMLTDMNCEGTVILTKSDYFSSFLTNGRAGHLAMLGEKELDGIRDRCSDASEGTLLGFDLDRLSNTIGISSLLITKDRKMVIWRQGYNLMSSAGLLVPSGSGSCDWEDVDLNNSLQSMVSKAMDRELLEESFNVSGEYDEINLTTKVIGYFRWLGKGGAPEFVGISHCDVESRDLFRSEDEIYEGSLYDVSSEYLMRRVIDELLSGDVVLSVPLRVNLLVLRRLLDEGDSSFWDSLGYELGK